MPLRIVALTSTATLALLLGAMAVGRAQTQSLAELAREGESRRKDVREPAKVYTNKDLGNVPPPSAPVPASDAAKTATPGAGAVDKDAKTAGGDAKDKGNKDVVKDQKYWSSQMKDLKSGLDRDQTYAEALQTRVNALTADFSSHDDPAQRSIISQDRQKALAELERSKKAIQNGKKAIADLEEEARRASVPAGWLR